MNENPLQRPSLTNFETEKGMTGRKSLQSAKWRILCGLDNILVSILVLALGGTNIIIFISYRGGFNREGLWVFVALAILSFSLALSFMARTCNAIYPCKAICQKKQKEKKIKNGQENKEKRPSFVPEAVVTHYYHLFTVNGKYYLTKMYISELFEHIQQVINLITIYVCSMPVAISTVMCAVLAVELIINIWATFNIVAQELRNRLILLDILTEIFCIAFPIIYLQFYLKVPTQLQDMILLTVYPMLSLHSKLNDIWEDYFTIDLERLEKKNRKNTTTFKKRGSRRRKSILNMSHNRTVMETQLKYFPKRLRYVFIAINISIVLFLVGFICISLATQPSTDECNGILTKEVWKDCRVEVPFCQHLFVAKCDCAVVEITNYTQKVLPESFVHLKSLVKMGIYTGRLEELPQSLGSNHERIRVLIVIGNRLKSLPDSIGNLKNLLNLLGLQQPTRIFARQRGKITEFAPALGI